MNSGLISKEYLERKAMKSRMILFSACFVTSLFDVAWLYRKLRDPRRL
jgi:hypothetical protein